MKSISNKDSKKIKLELGKKTNEGYKYKAKVDFSQDLSVQISKLIREKKANEIIKEKVKELRRLIDKFVKKEENLQYYYEMGKKLLFLDTDLFKDIARYSVFRRIIEELADILPHIEDKNAAIKHLDIMYSLAHLTREELTKIKLDQWYEILKFSQIYNDKKLLAQIIKECKENNLSGVPLRERIKELRRNK